MAQGQGQGVRGVVGPGDGFQVQQAAGGASVIDTVKLSMLTNAGALMIIAPLLLLFILAQKFFVAGVERTGLTGM